MDWIILNLITNKRNNKLIYGFLFGIIILDFLNDQIGFINEKYLIIDFSLFAIGLLIIKEILNYWYRNLYRRNQKILDDIKEVSRTGNYSKIIEQSQLIKIVKPQLTEKAYWTGFANVYLNNPQKALYEFDSIESEYQNFSGFFYHKGLALIDSGNIEKSIEYLTRSIELEKTWQNLDQRGVAYMNIDKLNEAEKDLRESIELKVDSSNTCNLGVVLYKEGQHKEAIEYYDKSINLDATQAHVYYNRAMAHHFLKNWKLAIRDYSKAQEMGHKNNDLYLNLGYCKCENGEIANGLFDLKKANELDCKEAKEFLEKYDNQ
jgi:tetratricopeptide (TPR) repeat protein